VAFVPGGVIVIDAVFELPFNAAVTVAVWFAVTVPAVAVKLPVEAPAPTVTEAGTVSVLLLSDSATDVFTAATPESVTVQPDVAPEATVAGVHCSPETVSAVDPTVVVPLAPEALTVDPVSVAAVTLLTEIVTLDPAPAVSFTVTVATTPSPMSVAFIPLAKHVSDAVPGAQFSVLPAAVSAGPAVALIEATSFVEYDKVHPTPAGAAPPDKDRSNETEPPGAADPDPRLNNAL
jgi:hypothetical protein